MNHLSILFLFLFIKSSLLFAGEFTISSYNAGGLSHHYDYLRSAVMEKLVQERYNAEPEQMSQNERIQAVALTLLFSSDSVEKELAQQEWDQKNYQKLIENLTESPTKMGSVNSNWSHKSENMITTYKVRPVVINDEKVSQMIDQQLSDLGRKNNGDLQERLQEVRATMATRIFADHLQHDIICLQEADYLDPSMFPYNYEVLFSENLHSKNGIAWNNERFELVETINEIINRAFAVKLRDKDSGKIILVASGHITGCNPYRVEKDLETGIPDSKKGDEELHNIVELFEDYEADYKLIAMDSNVTSLHPRLNILKNAGYQLDYKNYLGPTNTNPNLILNTRLDWIFLKSKEGDATIVNTPILSIGLNNIKTNVSDHLPIAAKVIY